MIQNIEQTLSLEQCVIGSVLLSPDVLDPVREIVRPADFSDQVNGQFFAFLCDLHDLGQPINDIELVRSNAVKRGLEISVAAIAEAFSSVPHVQHANYYAEEVAEASRLRRLTEMADGITVRALSVGAKSEEVVSFVESRLKTVNSSSRIELDDADTIADSYDPNRRDEVTTFSGLQKIDANFGGFTAGELICFGARMGTGKTALGWQVMLHSLQRERPCLFVSLEMSSGQLFERHLSSATGISSLKIRSGNLDSRQRDEIEVEQLKFRDYPVSVHAPPSATLRQIAAAAKLKQSGGGLSLLIVDYFQMIETTNRRAERHQQLAEISRDLKKLAGELNIPVIVLAQLNRQADNVVPRKAHIAESDQIAKDADQVWLLHRKEKSTDIRVDKHRYIQDDAAIEYRYDCGRFRDANEFIT